MPKQPTDLRNALTAAAFDITAVLPWRSACGIAPTLLTIAPAIATHALLIGNSRLLWPRFVDAYRDSVELRDKRDPFDNWIEGQLGAIVDELPHRFGHRSYDGIYIPLQRLAVAAGLGRLSETHLVIHPVFGPWFSLRAVVAISDDIAAIFAEAPTQLNDRSRCDSMHCLHNCQQLFSKAASAPPGSWKAWLAARAACCVGRDWQFSDAQIAYHYAKDTSAF